MILHDIRSYYLWTEIILHLFFLIWILLFLFLSLFFAQVLWLKLPIAHWIEVMKVDIFSLVPDLRGKVFFFVLFFSFSLSPLSRWKYEYDVWFWAFPIWPLLYWRSFFLFFAYRFYFYFFFVFVSNGFGWHQLRWSYGCFPPSFC